mmetsp:Transcript_34054/g.45001  ORF Transcript_34054/g.45001 Transcript_34054/m.45001 type:complete len:335 (-) Transcript_34054:235-1239(-)
MAMNSSVTYFVVKAYLFSVFLLQILFTYYGYCYVSPNFFHHELRFGKSENKHGVQMSMKNAQVCALRNAFDHGDSEVKYEGVRLNKCFKEFASRRESDRFIAEGRVTLNGKQAHPGDRAFPGDVVKLDGKSVEWEKLSVIDSSSFNPGTAQKQFEYIKFWKPCGVTSTTDLNKRDNMLDALGTKFRHRIYPVGRLDKDTSGIILLTSDGRLPDKLGRREQKKNKIYNVTVDHPISDATLAQLSRGVEITTKVQRDRKDRYITAFTLPCEVTRLSPRRFQIILQEGRNRQIRRMCEAVGYEVKELHRGIFCGIDLKGMRPGEWKKLSEEELALII